MAHITIERAKLNDLIAEYDMEQSSFVKRLQALAALAKQSDSVEQSAQHVGEPYGYLKLNTGKFVNEVEGFNPMKDKRFLPLYIAPQQRTTAKGEDTRRAWVGLTDEETNVLWMEGEANISFEHFSVVAYEIEAKLKEKNT